MKATARHHPEAAAVAMEARPRDRGEPAVAERGGDAVFGDESDGEFEFSFVSREPDAAAADDLFADGRIRAFYPVFGRAFDDAHEPPAAPKRRAPLGRLFLEEARNSSVGSTSSSSSSATTDGADLDGASPDSYCLWTPGSSAASSPARPPRKSGSTGSIARWRRIGDLVVGRSRSDGKEKFLFLSAPPSPAREPKGAKPRRGATEVDTIAAGRRMSYAPKAPAGTTHRTFLPYRQDLMGLFSNVNGLTRSPHRTF